MSRHRTLARGFQAGWLKSLDQEGRLRPGKKWFPVACGIDCSAGPDCGPCPALDACRKTGERVAEKPEELLKPLTWNKRPESVFVCAEGDPFHPSVSDDFIYSMFAVMESCPWHRFVTLTKRYVRAKQMLTDPQFYQKVAKRGRALLGERYLYRPHSWGDNILFGVSVGSQLMMHRAYILPYLPERITKVLFVAPMVSPVTIPLEVRRYLSLVVCSAERNVKGRKRRPCPLEWQIDLKDQVKAAGAAFFLERRFHPSWVKTMGGSFREFPEALFSNVGWRFHKGVWIPPE